VRIGIDATSILVPVKTGVQRYTTSLIGHLVQILPDEPDVELFLYVHSGDQYADPSLLSSYRFDRIPQVKVRKWPTRGYRVALGRMAALDRVNLLHLPEPRVPRGPSCPLVVTVHDLCWAHLPAELVSGERSSAMPGLAESARRARAFIAVSRSTRDDLTAEYGIAPERVWVTYEGVDACYQPAPQSTERVRRKYGLDRYILYVGTIQYRKNLVRLLEAYAQVVATGAVTQRLILVGSNGWGHAEVHATLARLGLHDRVVVLGYVADEDLPALYSSAELFVYPSLYEGFGLPVLEAMACGAPVAVSRCSSLPEVAGDAALYFDPYSVNDIAGRICEVLTSPRRSADLRSKGLQQSRRFTWKRTATDTLAIYRGIARSQYRRSTAD
jgi:glycosyltransferase involved in cell wall biosynthesis